jgi:tetratricopeptide (TPR) repeat protein
MKLILLFLLLVKTTHLFSQNGFELIRKAEIKIEKGKYRKALNFLEKADKLNYGFCGITKSEAWEAITLNRVKIFDAKGQYLEAANFLNSSSYISETDFDSLKMSYFLKVCDKQLMKKEIDSCLNQITSIDSIDFINGIELNVSFSTQPFIISFKSSQLILEETYRQTALNKDILLIDRFYKAFRNQNFYLLLLD